MAPSGWSTACALVVVTLVTVAAAPRPGGAQNVTVTGVVVERDRSVPVSEAAVRLSGSLRLTGPDGTFRFAELRSGRHVLTVEAFGYRTYSSELRIRGDTTLTIELEPEPIALDSLEVLAEDVTVRGQVVEAKTGQRVIHAGIVVRPGSLEVGALNGRFTIRDVPRGREVTIFAEAVGYLSGQTTFTTRVDTVLTFELEPDPVASRMLDVQAERLQTRAQAIPFPFRIIAREELDLTPTWPISDVIDTRLGSGSRDNGDCFSIANAAEGCAPASSGATPPGALPTPAPPRRPPSASSLDESFNEKCVFIDDALVSRGLLAGLTAAEVARVEIFDRGGMIRVYTKRYTMGLMANRNLDNIMYMHAGLGDPVCR